MGVIVRPELNGQFQPQVGSGYSLNTAHPLHRGQFAWWLANERFGSKMFDLYGNLPLAFDVSAPPTRAIESPGPVVYYPGTNKYSSTTRSWNYTGSYSLIWACRLNTLTNATRYIVFSNRSAANQGVSVGFYGNASGDGCFRVITQGVGEYTTTYALPKNTWAICGVSVIPGSPGTARWFVNGVFKEQTQVGTTAAGGNVINVGKIGQQILYYFKGSIGFMALYQRALLDGEQQMWGMFPYGTANNPRLLFPSKKAWFVPGSDVSSISPSSSPSVSPSASESVSASPSSSPSVSPSASPSGAGSSSSSPSISPSLSPSLSPSASPSTLPIPNFDETAFISHYDGKTRYFWEATGVDLY